MLHSVLRDQILRDGPLPFEAFMEACLYHEDHGFFVSGGVRSMNTGDFLTSPEVSPWFGRTLGRFVKHLDALTSERSGRNADVIEVAAGSGSLLTALLEEAGSDRTTMALDVSPAARKRLETIGPHVRVASSLEDAPLEINGLLLANELLDNLPVSLAQLHQGEWRELWVGISDAGLELVAAPMRPDVLAWVEAYGGNVAETGIVEVQLEAGEWLVNALDRLVFGSLVVIDYGGTASELEPRRVGGTLRTYRAHHLGPDPLTEPGETDVTVDVNFTAAEAIAKASGAEVEIVRQDVFLARLGLDDEIAAMRRRELELARSGDEMQRLIVRSELRGAETLLHPRGLGDFPRAGR